MAVGLIGGVVGAAGAGIGKIQSTVSSGINRVSYTLSGRIDSVQIIKYSIIAIIIFGLLILFVSGFRSLIVALDQFNCGLGNLGCDWPGIGSGVCSSCDQEAMPGYDLLWSEEWYLRCFFFLSIALMFFAILYTFIVRMFDWLLHIDRKIDDIDKWLFGAKRWLGDEEDRE